MVKRMQEQSAQYVASVSMTVASDDAHATLHVTATQKRI